MIISDSHKFLYVAVTKTGSTTLQKRLKRYQAVAKKLKKHSSLNTIYKQFPIIQDYFKFAIARNPFDWVVSWYFYRKTQQNKNNTKGISFKQWLVAENSSAYNTDGLGLTLSQYDIMGCDENIKLDFIGRYENLQEDFDTICDKIGIPKQQLPHQNKSKHKHYTEYYDDETRELVAEKFAKDIEYFGYEFGD
jgi:hypothetical protein